MITGLDHVALVVRDLDAAVDGYARMLGVAPNWIGRGGGVRQAWFQFPNMALDVISPEGEGAFADGMRAHLDAKGEGQWAVAFTAENIEAFATLLTRRGIKATTPAPVTTTADDGATRTWIGANLSPKDTGGLQYLLMAPAKEPWPLSKPTGPGPIAKLDHVVVTSGNVDRALGIYGAKLGLDLRLDRENPQWSARQLFFRCGDAVFEMAAKVGEPDLEALKKPDRWGGLAWRVDDPDAAQARIAAAGLNVSEVRAGRKPGTKVFTVRDAPGGIPTIMLSAEPKLETA